MTFMTQCKVVQAQTIVCPLHNLHVVISLAEPATQALHALINTASLTVPQRCMHATQGYAMTGELGRGCQSTAGVIHHTVSSDESVVSVIVDFV